MLTESPLQILMQLEHSNKNILLRWRIRRDEVVVTIKHIKLSKIMKQFYEYANLK